MSQSPDDLKAELAALRAARAARAAERSKPDEVLAMQREIAKEKALEKLEVEHGPVGTHLHVFDTDEGAIVVKRPAPVVFKRYVDAKVQGDEQRMQLVQACVVYPERAEFNRIAEALPGAVATLVIAVNRLAGFRNEDAAGK